MEILISVLILIEILLNPEAHKVLGHLTHLLSQVWDTAVGVAAGAVAGASGGGPLRP
jgi:hypothetical protein